MEDGFECYTRFLDIHAKKGFAIFKAAGMTNIPDEMTGCLSEALKACLKILLRGSVPVMVEILPGDESQRIEVLERWREYRAHR